MSWHPATGIGLIALGNLRYADVGGVAGTLPGLVREGAPRAAGSARPLRGAVPWVAEDCSRVGRRLADGRSR